MFTTEISTLIKKSLLSSPNLESYSVDFCCALQTRHSRAALPVLEGGPWLLIITQGESGDFMAFSGPTLHVLQETSYCRHKMTQLCPDVSDQKSPNIMHVREKNKNLEAKLQMLSNCRVEC